MTVSVDDGVSDRVSQTFNWTVGLTTHTPTLDSIDDQVNAAGDSVDVAVADDGHLFASSHV